MKRLLPSLLIIVLFVFTTNAQNAERDFSFNIGTGFNGEVRASALQPDGKLVVGGAFTSYNGTTRNYIARLDTDGTLDTSFDPGSGVGSTVLGLAIQPSDGRIIIVGTFGSTIARLNTDGTVDGTFSTVGTGFNSYGSVVLIQPADEKIIIGGAFTSYNGTSRNRIARLNTDGSLDTDFNPSTGFNNQVRALALQDDGKVVAVGHFTDALGQERKYVARLTSTGTLDAAFTPGNNIPGNSTAVAIQADGKILVGSQGLFRLNADGSLDNTLVTSFSNSAPYFNQITAIKVQSDNKILVGGWFLKGLRRIQPNGNNDQYIVSSGESGLGGFDKPPGLAINTIVVQSNGDVIAAGDFDRFNGTPANNILRLTTCTSVTINQLHEMVTRCENNNATFSIDASASYTYKWQFATSSNGLYDDLDEGISYTGTTTSTLNINGVSSVINGFYYRCLISDGNCTSTTPGRLLTVTSVPVFNTQPQSAAACNGENLSFIADVSNPGSYQWQVDEGSGFNNISGANSTTLLVTNITPNKVGFKYRLKAGSCEPTIYSNEATITAVNEKPEITTQPQLNTGICGSNDLTITVAATGTGLTYQWQYYLGSNTYASLSNGANAATSFKLGGNYSGVNGNTLNVTSITANTASATDPALYRVIISNPNSCSTTSNLAFVRLYNTPVITTQPADVSRCSNQGGNILLSVGLATVPSGITYQWQANSGSGFANIINSDVYAGTNSATLSITGTAAASLNGYKYRCIVGTCTPSVISAEATLTIDIKPVITSISSNVTICPTETAEFEITATGSNMVYQWQQNSGAGFVNISDNDNFFGTQSNKLVISDVTSAFHSRSYRCIIKTDLQLCEEVISPQRTLSVTQLPTFNSQPVNRTICEGASTTFSFSAANSSGTFKWQVDTGNGLFVDLTNNDVFKDTQSSGLFIPNATANLSGYKFRCRVGACPTETYTEVVSLTVNALPKVTSEPENQVVCTSGTTSFNIEATGTNITYRWHYNGGPIADNAFFSGTTTNTLTITNAFASLNNGKFHCVVSGTCTPAASSKEVVLTVNEMSVTTHPENQSICVNDNATFTVSGTGPDISYQWQIRNTSGTYEDLSNGGFYTGVSTPTLSITGANSSLHQSMYQCVISGACESKNSNPAQLRITSPPKPVITSSTSNQESYTLQTGGGESYQWFKDGAPINGATGSSITVNTPGFYTVQLILQGCQSEMSNGETFVITGLPEFHDFKSEIKVYPNPSSDVIHMQLDAFEKDTDVQITLIDLLGRTLKTSNGKGKQLATMNVQDINQGRYIIIFKQHQLSISKPLIKSN